MKYSKCSVPGCNSIRQDVKLHKFPKCEKRLKQWLDSIKCDTLRGLNVAELDRLQVCHKHFEQRFVTEKSGILGNAYPTLFSPEEISTGIPSRTLEDDEKSGPSVEHNYSRKRHFDHTYGQQEASTSVKGGGVASTYSIDSTLKPMSHNLSGATISYPVSSVLPHPVPDTIPLVHHKQGSEKKKKLVQTVESLTPKCKILYREYRKTKKLLNFTRRAKRALRFSNEHSFEKKIAEMNPIARKVLLMQVRLCAKEIKGRRFSLEEKLISLSIMKQSPKAYKFLQRIFILPSMTTLKKTIQKLNVEPGINTQIFESIKEEVDTWKNEKKYCSIIFDEMALEPGLTYTHRDQIIGLVDLQNKTDEFADHALVFMVKGAVYKWQQTIAYYFCKGATPASEMKNIINEIVSAVGNTGLIPVALISDQGTAFQSAIKSLREETRRLQILADENTDDTIKINGFNISVIADPPHLIKGIRNNFLTKEISFDGKRAKWMDIVDVYKTDCQHANTRLLHKLNDEHVIPEKVKKMKVKNCVRVFSKTMAGALNYTSEFSHYADGRTVSSTLANTAEVVSFLDDLFDSVNGASILNTKRKGKKLRTAVTASSEHHRFWREALQSLDRLKFVNERGHEVTVPSIKNWVTTIKSFQRLWNFFKDKGIKILRPRYFNSDAIENYFGQVRAYNFRNVNPDCHTFANTFKSLLVTGFIKFHSATFNCEEDNSKQLVKIKSLFRSLTLAKPANLKPPPPQNELDFSESLDHTGLLQNTVTEARRERLSVHARAYTAGWVIRKIHNFNKCKDCISNLTITQKFKMILLSGNTLPERQKQLNEKVIKASVDDFNKYKAEAAAYDVDKMFLIDLAAKGKNIDFILETFKSGDIVYITRALNKSKWIGEDEYANHINVDNLHHNIFPLMSVKMKKKVLSVLSAAVTTENRSIAFYEYCLKEKLINIAFKFLYNAPEKYKQDVILQKKSEALKYLQSNFEEVVANFIGNSFILARTLLETMDNEWRRGSLLMLLHNMYSLSNEKYLDLLEKYKQIENRREISGFGRRISKDIIKKHKRRVLSNPFLYLHLLRKSIVSSNSTVSDVKIYAVALLPDDAETFWNMNFYNKYQFILDIIPANEKFTFIKKIFLEKYPGKSFEMSKDFYSHNFYYMMTNEEKETWALNHINSTLEVLGNGNDYTWYKFVQFDKAFEEIKKYVLITSDADKRVDMVKVLIDSAKSQKEIEILLKYFHDRHMNEERHLKYRFLEKLTEKHKVLDFHEECWIPFEKLLYSLDVFDITHSRYNECNYRAMTLIYYILRDKTVPAVVKNTLTEYQIVDTVKKCSRDLEPEKLEKVFQFMLKFYHSSIEASASKDIGEKSDTSMAVDAWVHAYLEILLCQSKTKEEIPDIINKFLKMNWDSFKYHRLLKSENDEYSERNIVRLMKKDATLVINEFPLIKQFIENRYGRTNWLLQKLKLYFHNDIAQKYLQLLTDCLSNEDMHYRMAQVAVYGILILADESFKIEFVQKYVPTNPKIDHKNTPRGLLHIQQAICAYASVSRPPLPLSSVQQYITGDYVHSCLPIFNSYLMNLPLPASVSFVESLINKPVSIQKHGLRLAFKCFSTDNLKTLLTDIWKRTKNVSIRKILYKSLIDRVLKESDDEQSQQELFEVLKKLTLDIHQDDDDEIFKSFVNGSLPLSLRVQLLVAAWTTVKKLPDRCVNFERRTSIVNAMKSHVHFVPEVEIEIITDEHISYMLANRLLLSTAMRINELNELNKAKWDLTLAHLTNINNEEQLKKRTVIVKRVIEKCVEIMLETRPQESGESYINARPREDYVKSYQFCRDFIISLQNHSYECHKLASYSFINILNSSIYHQLQNSQLKSQELFSLSIQLRLSEISRNSIISASQELSANAEVGDKSVAFKRCLDRFSIRLHTLLIEYIANGKYFSSFHRQIDAYILDEIERVYNTLFDDGSLNWNDDDVIVAACGSLLKFDLHELRMIVLRILPVNYDCLDRPLYTAPCIKDYQVAIDQLKMVNNEEVRQFLHEKFVLHNPIV